MAHVSRPVPRSQAVVSEGRRSASVRPSMEGAAGQDYERTGADDVVARAHGVCQRRADDLYDEYLGTPKYYVVPQGEVYCPLNEGRRSVMEGVGPWN